jgi:hypothetical protein
MIFLSSQIFIPFRYALLNRKDVKRRSGLSAKKRKNKYVFKSKPNESLKRLVFVNLKPEHKLKKNLKRLTRKYWC